MNVKLADRPVSSGASGPGGRIPRGEREGRASWWAGWRVALRLARRDIRAHRGRSALVMVMIAIPVALMVFGVGFGATSEVTTAERPEAVMGSGTAQLVYTGPNQVQQSPNGRSLARCGGAQTSTGGTFDESFGSEGRVGQQAPCEPATPIPGLVVPAGGRLSVIEAAGPVSRLVGAPVVPYQHTRVTLGADYGYSQANLLIADARDDAFRGMVDLTSGRWPVRPGEAAVTEAGLAKGLPESGAVSGPGLGYVLAGERLTIVGTASAPKGTLGTHDIVTLPSSNEVFGSEAYIVMGDAPMRWENVLRLNEYGFMAVSRAVLSDPPGPLAEIAGVDTPPTPGDTYPAAAFTALLLVVSCLIAGPAFAVMASRQRRMLALAAANGAPGSALRQAMVAQAILLGAGAVVLGIAAGLAVLAAVMTTGWRLVDGFGPFDVPGAQVAGIAGVAVVASVISALIPTRRLGELEVARALAGDVVQPRVRRTQPVIGGLLTVAGTGLCMVGVLLPIDASPGENTVRVLLIFAATVMVVIGALMLVPAVLVAVGRLGSRLPVSARMAARDAARLHGRATSTVAAVMAGGILLSSAGLVLASQDSYARRVYTPTGPYGHMVLPSAIEPAGLRQRVEAAVPGVTVRSAEVFRDHLIDSGDGETRSVVGVLRPGCDPLTEPGRGFDPPCLAGIEGRAPNSVVAAEPADAAALFGFDAAAVGALRRGSAVVTDASVLDGQGKVTLVVGRYLSSLAGTSADTWNGDPTLTSRPAVVTTVSPPSFDGNTVGAVISTEAARALSGAESTTVYVAGPADPTGHGLTDEQAAAVNHASDAVFPAEVERGYTSLYPLSLWVLAAMFALLTLVATVTATALAMGEARRDLATLAAVGAPEGRRRAVAAWQSGGLAFVGTTFGLLAGAVPGVVLSLATTGTLTGYYTGGVPATEQWNRNVTQFLTGEVVVPWWPLLVALVVVPLVAALFGWLFAGGRVDMTRRMD